MRTAPDGTTSVRCACFGTAYISRARFGRLAVTALATLGLLAALSACGMNPRSADRVSGPAGAPTAAAGATPVPVGSSAHTISIGGLTRSYIVYRPAALPAAAPLVVMLHGGFGSASQAEKSYGWNTEADSGHFLV